MEYNIILYTMNAKWTRERSELAKAVATPHAKNLHIRGNHLSNITCLKQVSSKVANNIANCGDP